MIYIYLCYEKTQNIIIISNTMLYRILNDTSHIILMAINDTNGFQIRKSADKALDA